MSNTREFLDDIRASLSLPRLSTYELAVGVRDPNDPAAVALYAWNARISAALLAPMHICEVVVRNAVSEALVNVYGPRWPWEPTFLTSLPNPRQGYNPRTDLTQVAGVQPSTGKVIPELKFIFWQGMFTRRHDVRIWNPHFTTSFSFHNKTTPISALRNRMYSGLDELRKLRNRIAHHEPIFTRNLKKDFELMTGIVELRSPRVASWMICNQDAIRIMSQAPLFKGGGCWTPSREEISKVAYRLWEEQGRRNGHAESDWALAERLMGLFD